MIAVSLAALCVFMFGAYAYGATVVLAIRQSSPAWSDRRHPGVSGAIAPVTLTLCAVCTAWFILQGLLEFRLMMGAPRWRGVPEVLSIILTFAFPPLIMHTVLHEAECERGERRPRSWRLVLGAMYVVATAITVWILLAGYEYIPRPRQFNAWTGLSVGGLFTLCSIYCMAVLLNRPAKTPTTQARGLRHSMLWLFVVMIGIFLVLTFMREQRLLMEVLDRVSRSMPLAFLIVSIYFENRFEFYDLIVKRSVMLVVSVLIVGGFMTVSLAWLDELPAGAARPWLYAVTLVPLAMVIPWLHQRIGRWLDRMWFGREFTAVEAVKHVLAAMQPATDEALLVAAAEGTLSEMFSTPVRILREKDETPEGATIEAVVQSSTETGAMPLRVAVLRQAGSRLLLSEDLMLLRSLVNVFGYMLENIRLQRKRQEQEQLEQELRLQSSRSELKALRAQINPHFLFNALNAIASLIHTDPTRADAAVEQLAEVFRHTLRRSDQEWSPLDQELAFAQAYLDVEQARFGKRLTVTIEADRTAAKAYVPSMLLHTLAENAVKHGISRMRGPGRIDVRTTATGETLTLEVRDTGPGLDGRTPPADGEHFGLRSVRDRLAGHFGNRASMSLTREGDTTVARIDMPLVLQGSTEIVASSERRVASREPRIASNEA
jgi:signal transduction histidine kinase